MHPKSKMIDTIALTFLLSLGNDRDNARRLYNFKRRTAGLNTYNKTPDGTLYAQC